MRVHPGVAQGRPAGAFAHETMRARSEKRDRILDAATAVFARHGYHGSRVADIAREAGIAYGLVYHYFKNKEEILATIFEERWSGFLEAVEDIAASPAPAEDRLVSLAALVLHGYQLRPDWVKVFVLEIQRSSRFAEPAQLRAIGRLFDAVERIIRSGQERGELRAELDAPVAVYVFMGALDLVITSLVIGVRRIDGGERDERDFYLRVARTVVEIFLRGLASKEPRS
jgi:TetR/AcrR family transcriptional regulator, fatty acid metabolism regulator protein